MYENYIKKIKSTITTKRLIIGALCVLLIVGIGQLARGYLTAQANYHRAIEHLERAKGELERSKQLNRELQQIIERGQSLNVEAGSRIERIEDYQRRTEQGIDRAQDYQRETGSRVSESLYNTQRARELLERNLQLIDGVERRDKEEQSN